MPVASSDGLLDASGRSGYTVLVLRDGTAMSAGHVENKRSYQGHLGIDMDEVDTGVNELRPISQVYNSEATSMVDAPIFEKAFAGVENSPDSGIIHTVLLDAQGRAWAVSSNSNGQLCLGDVDLENG